MEASIIGWFGNLQNFASLFCYTYTSHPIENSFEKIPTSFHSNRSWLALERYRTKLFLDCALCTVIRNVEHAEHLPDRVVRYSILERVDAYLFPRRVGSRFFLNRHCIFSKSFLWTDKVVNRLRMFAHLLLTRWNVSFVRHRWIGWVVFERINYVVDFYSFFLLERKLIGALMAITKNRTKSIFFSSSSLSFWFRSHFDNLISLINYAIFELKFAVQRYKYNFNQHF